MTTQLMFIRLKLLRHQCTENLWIFFSLFCAKYVAFLCYWSAWFEASVEYSKYVIDEMCRRCNFSWTACWIRLWLFWTFISPGATVIDVTVIFGVFFVVLDKKSDLSCSFDGASSEIRRKIGLRQNTDSRSADPLLTPLTDSLKNHREKIQSVIQIKFINITLPEVRRMAGECCNGLSFVKSTGFVHGLKRAKNKLKHEERAI